MSNNIARHRIDGAGVTSDRVSPSIHVSPPRNVRRSPGYEDRKFGGVIRPCSGASGRSPYRWPHTYAQQHD
jgi:hypothetical protein